MVPWTLLYVYYFLLFLPGFIRMLTVIDTKRRNRRVRTGYMCGGSQSRGWQARRAQADDPGGQPNWRFLQ
jgi:hypothetical protein